MANYNNVSQAYDLSLFDMSAPQKVAEEKRKEFEVVKPIKKTKEQIHLENVKDAKLVLRVALVSLILFTLIGMQIFANLRLNEFTALYNQQQNRLQIAQSENTRLKMEFDSMVAPEKIAELAESKLGMVQRENYQVSFFDLSEGDSVVVSQ